MQGPHFVRGGGEEALQTLNNGGEVGHQQLLGSVGWKAAIRSLSLRTANGGTSSALRLNQAELLTDATDGGDSELFDLEVLAVVEGGQHRLHQGGKVGRDVFPCSVGRRGEKS